MLQLVVFVIVAGIEQIVFLTYRFCSPVRAQNLLNMTSMFRTVVIVVADDL